MSVDPIAGYYDLLVGHSDLKLLSLVTIKSLKSPIVGKQI